MNIDPSLTYLLYFDGSARPECAGIGAIIKDPVEDKIISKIYSYIGGKTNN